MFKMKKTERTEVHRKKLNNCVRFPVSDIKSRDISKMCDLVKLSI